MILRREFAMRAWAAIALLALLMLLAGMASVTAMQGNSAPPATEALLREASEWVRVTPALRGNYEYAMVARVRLLLFWVSREDVGGGTIRRGAMPDDPQREMISLLIGSDPAKAPRKINRWGAAMEVVRRAPNESKTVETSAFFGFMTRAKGEATAGELKEQMEKEKSAKAFQYQAVISRLDSGQGIAKTVPFATEKELDIHQLEPMKEQVFAELGSNPGKYRQTPAALQQKCPRVSGFLASVAELVDGALDRNAMKGQACYIHYGELYTLKLASAERVAVKAVKLEMKSEPKVFEHTYRDLLDAHFEILNHQTGKKSEFTLLMATNGRLRGVPVQITYQPNWWFQVILHLKPEQSTN